MRNLLLETSNFNGDIILENFEFEGDYDHLFKGIRKAFKERGLLGGLGQITGLSTNKGAERREEKREAKAERKEDKNERKNIVAEATAAQQAAEAVVQQSQAGLVDSIAQEQQAQAQTQAQAQEQTTDPAAKPKEDNTIMYASIAGGVLLVIVLIVVVLMRRRSPIPGV